MRMRFEADLALVFMTFAQNLEVFGACHTCHTPIHFAMWVEVVETLVLKNSESGAKRVHVVFRLGV